MPQPYSAAVITAKGEELLARAAAGLCTIEYTKMEIGNGTYSNADKDVSTLKKRTALKAKKNEYSFSGVEIVSEKCVTLTALISNQDAVTSANLVSEGYYINEVGIRAKEKGADDSTAILYSICITASISGNGDYLPAFTGHNRAEITQCYMITVDNSAEITVNIQGAAMLAEDANKIADSITGAVYKVGIENGAIYYQCISGDGSTDKKQLMIIDTNAIILAFQEVYGEKDSDSLSLEDIEQAINNGWDGSSSEDITAMSAEDVNTAVTTTWSGESSKDSEALNAGEVDEATK